MSDVPAQGALAKLCMDPDTIDTGSQAFEFLTCDLKRLDTHIHSGGIRGTRSRFSGRVRIAQRACSGPIVMHPSATEIDWIIQRALGGTTAAGVTAVAETLPEFLVAVDRITKVHTYSGCRINRWTLSGSAGQAIQMTCEIEAESESEGAAGSFPSLTLPTDNMFIFSDLTLTLEGAARKFANFSLTVNNFLDAQRFLNSLTRGEIAPQDREVTLQVSAPYTSDNEDLYDAAVAGAAGSLVFDDGTDTYTIDFGNLKIPAETPNVPGKSELFMPLNLMSYFDGTNREIKITKT